jgi:hypothetical protein
MSEGKTILDLIFLVDLGAQKGSALLIQESEAGEALEFIEKDISNPYKLLAICPKRETEALIKFFRLQKWKSSIEKIIRHEKKEKKKILTLS